MEEIVSRDGKEIVLVYSIASPEDVDEVAEFAEQYFYNDSPLREIASFDDISDKEGMLAWRRGRLQTCFAQPISILVRDKSNGELVAFAARVLQEKNEKMNWPSSNPRSPGWLNRAMAAEMKRGVDLFSHYKTDRILLFWFGAISKQYRGRIGIFGENNVTYHALTSKTLQDFKVGAIETLAFSRFAAKQKYWQVIRSMDFEEFRLPDGSRPLANVDLGPHRTAQLKATPASAFLDWSNFILKSKL